MGKIRPPTIGRPTNQQVFLMFHAARKVLIWTMAAAIPIQGLPVGSCHCASAAESASVDRSVHGAQEHAGTCCSARGARHSCCSARHRHAPMCCCCAGKACGGCHHCTCGIDCPCRQKKQPSPATPPVGQRPLEKVLCLTLDTTSLVAVTPHVRPQRLAAALSPFDAAGGLDRCISLCRFTL
jgi:hypothetical protein